jgi:hypothetical protein
LTPFLYFLVRIKFVKANLQHTSNSLLDSFPVLKLRIAGGMAQAVSGVETSNHPMIQSRFSSWAVQYAFVSVVLIDQMREVGFSQLDGLNCPLVHYYCLLATRETSVFAARTLAEFARANCLGEFEVHDALHGLKLPSLTKHVGRGCHLARTVLLVRC